MIDKVVNLVKDPRVALSVLLSIGLVIWLNPLPVAAITIVIVVAFCVTFLLAAFLGLLTGLVRKQPPAAGAG